MSDSLTKPNKIVVPIIMYDGKYFLLVSDRESDDSRWRYPSTWVAEGETLKQAAARAAWFKTGLVIEPERFGDTIRSLEMEDGRRFNSVRANLTPEEFARLRESSPSGKHLVLSVAMPEIKKYLPHKFDRKLMNAGS